MKHIWLAELAGYMAIIEDGNELNEVCISRLNELKLKFAELCEGALLVLVDDILRENMILQEVNALPDIEGEEDND